VHTRHALPATRGGGGTGSGFRSGNGGYPEDHCVRHQGDPVNPDSPPRPESATPTESASRAPAPQDNRRRWVGGAYLLGPLAGQEDGAPAGQELEISSAFERTVHEGHRRLRRTWPGLLATGAVGGVDVSMGLLALLIVDHATGNILLAALAFSIGFIALTLAGSELFTENFLVPIAAVAARRSSVLALARLWIGTLVTNLLSGWVMTGIIIAALPDLRPTAVKIASTYPHLGVGKQSFCLALLGGVVITLMTWMERSTTSVPAKIVAAVCAAFLLASASLNHAVFVSLEMFAALHAGAPFGYAVWFRLMLWASLGNMLGGVGLVTVLRLVQVGRKKLQEEEQKSAAGAGP
jgi:formate/nitrite transporter FocA (FNT family)